MVNRTLQRAAALPINRAMSLEAALSRIAQIEGMMSGAPVTASTAAAAAATAATPTTSTGTAAGSASTFATQLQSAIAPDFASATLQPLAAAVTGAGTSTGQELVNIAQSQVGQSEQPPGSNDGPAIAQYRTATTGAAAGAPWCAYFVSWVARQAGEPIGSQGQGLGYVGDVWSWAQQTGRTIPNGRGVTPQPGDLIVFGDHHVGIVKQVLPNGSIETIEGNYDNRVSQVVRGPGEATGYVRM